MFVNVTLKDIKDGDKIDVALAESEPLRRLVQKHNRIAYETKDINVIDKNFSGKELKNELEKHPTEVLIGLLHEYISVTKVHVHEDGNGVELELINKPSTELIVEKKKELNDTISDEPKEEEDTDLSIEDKLYLKKYFIKMVINVAAFMVVMIFGMIVFISWQLKQMPDNSILSTVFKGIIEIAAYIFQ